ncbi:MAG: Asp-tRNA(Asn)/Glu-tRNA(Gln) amidotransferase subunit GatA [Phycisphaerales bacterium]|nr:Asp-tRNA(Asn)/Glu-tRNA(Gln) amidotransferase subunit GatA [Phycisphaerales bacterium]
MIPPKNILEHIRHIQNRAYTCVDLTIYYLERIKEHNQQLNAFVQVYADSALQQARELDDHIKQNKPLKRLHGVVIGIKDLIAYQKHPLTAASKILEGHYAPFTATALQKLIDEGAIIIGSQNCDEFGMGNSNRNSIYGPVKNFLDQTKTSGGSSGGSAVAVSAQLCMVSLGTDTGGSVRQPADFTGIYGFKPSYGRVSRYGLVAYASSFDQIGVLANDLYDIALVLEIMAGRDPHDDTSSPLVVDSYSKELTLENTHTKKYKIAYFDSIFNYKYLESGIKKNVLETIDTLRTLGHTVEAVPFDYLDYIVPIYYILTTAEASSNLARYDGIRFGYRATANTLKEQYTKTRTEGFGWEVKKRLMLGKFVLSSQYLDNYYLRSLKIRQLLLTATTDIFAQYDAIIMPTVPMHAWDIEGHKKNIEQDYLSDIFTVYANLVGIPAMSIPLYRHKENNMPFGLQIMTASFNESLLVQFANYILKTVQKQ